MIGSIFRRARREIAIRRDAVAWARSIGVVVGERCRLLGINGETFGSEPYLVRLGDHVTVTAGVRFITHDGGVWIYREQHPQIDVVDPIIIGRNVFIGINAILLPGTRVGDDCVIGAGSVVKGVIPSGTIAAGVPARPIRSKEEYWSRIEPRLDQTHDMPEAERRRLWTTRFARLLAGEREE